VTAGLGAVQFEELRFEIGDVLVEEAGVCSCGPQTLFDGVLRVGELRMRCLRIVF
jgi:hypothetical protein